MVMKLPLTLLSQKSHSFFAPQNKRKKPNGDHVSSYVWPSSILSLEQELTCQQGPLSHPRLQWQPVSYLFFLHSSYFSMKIESGFTDTQSKVTTESWSFPPDLPVSPPCLSTRGVLETNSTPRERGLSSQDSASAVWLETLKVYRSVAACHLIFCSFVPLMQHHRVSFSIKDRKMMESVFTSYKVSVIVSTLPLYPESYQG